MGNGLMTDLPLIEYVEGKQADNRAALFAAWVRINRGKKPHCTTLHVRELLMYVFAVQPDPEGQPVKLTYEEIAVKLECRPSLARRIVDRAANEYGMLAVEEDYLASGARTANRYSIDWPIVRAINAGRIERASAIGSGPSQAPKNTPVPPSRPTALSAQCPALSAHSPALSAQANKEYSSTKTSTKTTTSTPYPQTQDDRPSVRTRSAGWAEVEAAFLALGEHRMPREWQSGLRSARAAGVTPEHVLGIIAHYTAHGTGYAPGALFRRLQRCHPQFQPSEGWPPAQPSVAVVNNASRNEAIRRVVTRIETDTIRAGQRARKPDVDIRAAIAEQLRARGLDPQLSTW